MFVHRVQLAPICILVIVYENIISLELVLETVVTNTFFHKINPLSGGSMMAVNYTLLEVDRVFGSYYSACHLEQVVAVCSLCAPCIG